MSDMGIRTPENDVGCILLSHAASAGRAARDLCHRGIADPAVVRWRYHDALAGRCGDVVHGSARWTTSAVAAVGVVAWHARVVSGRWRRGERRDRPRRRPTRDDELRKCALDGVV